MCRFVKLLVATGVFVVVVVAQTNATNIPSCDEVFGMAQMARARSIRDLDAVRAKAGASYHAQLVYAYLAFRLRPNSSVEAERLLLLIPRTDEQLGSVVSLGSSLCDKEPLADMQSLGKVSDDLAHQFANAVLIVPRYMTVYVAHSLDEVQDPHSEYAVNMKTVCQRRHGDFIAAVARLSPERRRWFANGAKNLPPVGPARSRVSW